MNMHNQENLLPEQPLVKQVATPAGSPPRPANGQPVAAFPVKNTFIHYGTPVRTTMRTAASPKTVPPNFAPEGVLRERAAPSAQAPFLMPVTGLRNSPRTLVTGPVEEGTSAKSSAGGVAPLRLFDFLPSPTLTQAPPPELPNLQSQATVSVPPLVLGNGATTSLPLWHRLDISMSPLLVSVPNSLGPYTPVSPFSSNAEGFQTVSWPWGGSECNTHGGCAAMAIGVGATAQSASNTVQGLGLGRSPATTSS